MHGLIALQKWMASDPARMRILHSVRALDLPDCWVAAGFVRNCVWDHLHQRATSPLAGDVDVIHPVYLDRISAKNWLAQWPLLTVEKVAET